MWGGNVSTCSLQGFHRYSTDQHWHVPHFEKMLYDQGQLAATYSRAFQVWPWHPFAVQMSFPALCQLFKSESPFMSPCLLPPLCPL